MDPSTLSVINTRRDVNAGAGLERLNPPLATWAVSTAPVGNLIRSHDGRPLYLRVNGSDAHARPLQAILTRVPASGSLSVAATIGESRNSAQLAQATIGVGERIPVGTRLVYRPETEAHDPWLEGSPGKYEDAADWTAADRPFEWLAFRVMTEGGERSVNEATVALSVRPESNPLYLGWSEKVGG